MVESFGMKIKDISDTEIKTQIATKIITKHAINRKLRRDFSNHLEQKYAFGGTGYLEAKQRFYNKITWIFSDSFGLSSPYEVQ